QFRLIQRQVDNLAADSLWDAVPDPIRPGGAIGEGFWSAALIAIIPAVERRSGNDEFLQRASSRQRRLLDRRMISVLSDAEYLMPRLPHPRSCFFEQSVFECEIGHHL